MIIDCHVHINHYDDENTPALPNTLVELERQMHRNRVDFAVILTSFKVNPGRPSTRDTLNAIRGHNNLFIVAGIDYDSFSDAAAAELRELLKDDRVRGLKLYPGYQSFYPHDPRLKPVFQLAEEFHVPVMIHTGDTYSARGKVKFAHPLHIDEVAVDNPNVNIIICHLGNPWFQDTMEIVYKNQNVYTDISGLVLGNFTDRFERYMRDQLQEMMLFGMEPDRLLYGTDWPISSMESYLKFMEELRMPLADRNKIMFENAARLFRIAASQSPYHTKSVLDWLKG